MKQQTAVEFLIGFIFEKLPKIRENQMEQFILAFAKSIEMENDQIIKAYNEARKIGCKCYDDLDDKNAEPYYNETYKK